MLKSHWNPKLQTARPKKARKERMSRSKRAKRRRGRTSDQGERTEKYVDWTWWRGCLSNHNFNSRSYCQLTNWAHVYIYICKIYICGLALTNKSNRELKLGFGALSIFFGFVWDFSSHNHIRGCGWLWSEPRCTQPLMQRFVTPVYYKWVHHVYNCRTWPTEKR